jgi:hypothetical protein
MVHILGSQSVLQFHFFSFQLIYFINVLVYFPTKAHRFYMKVEFEIRR